MGQIGKLVFGTNNTNGNKEEEEEFVGEGLMIPGGSLANLTAMHAARHRWRVMNGYTKQQQQQKQHDEYRQWLDNINDEEVEEEEEKEKKKVDDMSLNKHINAILSPPPRKQKQHLYITNNTANEPEYDLVAFVSSEAHYSFAKSARVLGLREDDLIVIPTNADGSMNVEALAKSFYELEYELEQIVKERDIAVGGGAVGRNGDVKRVKRVRFGVQG